MFKVIFNQENLMPRLVSTENLSSFCSLWSSYLQEQLYWVYLQFAKSTFCVQLTPYFIFLLPFPQQCLTSNKKKCIHLPSTVHSTRNNPSLEVLASWQRHRSRNRNKFTKSKGTLTKYTHCISFYKFCLFCYFNRWG